MVSSDFPELLDALSNRNPATTTKDDWSNGIPSPSAGLKRAIFLDRDGTVNQEVNYLDDPAAFQLLPGVAETIARWNEQGWVVVLVTNQSGVARGYFSLDTLQTIHHSMCEQLAQVNARIDGIYVCPHHPNDGCDCRKPATALFERAARDLELNLGRSYFVGDKVTDLLPAQYFGARSFLVRTGHGKDHIEAASASLSESVAIVDDLPAVAHWLESHCEEMKPSG